MLLSGSAVRVLLCRLLALLLTVAALAVSAFPQDTAVALPYQDSRLPLERRVDDLISRMTLEEKISQMVNSAPAIPRLGIPEYNWWSEGLHGLARAGNATVFPQAIALAATFDKPLIHDVADVISTEARAIHHEGMRKRLNPAYRGLTIWSPNINIFRDPRWGRGQETYGEDPYLTSQIGIAFVTGLQGDDPRYLKAVSTPKHFAVHSGPESLRHTFDVRVSPHDLEDTYLPAFRATIMEGHAEAIMCVYNSVDGKPGCASDLLLQQHLRDAWRFPGHVTSDCGAVADIFQGHRYAASMEEATAAALKAGTDLTCGDQKTEGAALLRAVRSGLVSEALVDKALRRLFRARFRLGMFDPPSDVRYAQIPISENDTEGHRQLALRTAREAMVLLKNKNNFLPLKGNYKTIAVLGPNADSLDALVGNYNGTPSHPVTPLAGIKRRFPAANVLYVNTGDVLGRTSGVVPSGQLSDASGQPGLQGEYFAGRDLQGSAVLTRLDPSIDFDWGLEGVNPQLKNEFSARWNGYLTVPKSGEYGIGVAADDGFRLWLDDQLIVEDWTTHATSTLTKKVPLQAGRKYRLKLEYFQGTGGADIKLLWEPPNTDPYAAALDAVRQSDLAVLVLGISPQLEGEEMNVKVDGFSGGDRTKLDLPQLQQDFLQNVMALGKPTVLVLMNGSALAVDWAQQNVDAILEAWYPGEEGGTAIAETLAGDNDPGGRLPVTFYKSHQQLPPFEEYSMRGRTYRYFSGEPLYPFGYGLSYTTFKYSRLKSSSKTIDGVKPIVISAEIVNSGAVAGDEVAQLYISQQADGAPVRALQGFTRVHLKAGEKKKVSFTVQPRQFGIVNDQGERKLVPGVVILSVGGGQPTANSGSTFVSTTLKVAGSATFAE